MKYKNKFKKGGHFYQNGEMAKSAV